MKLKRFFFLSILFIALILNHYVVFAQIDTSKTSKTVLTKSFYSSNDLKEKQNIYNKIILHYPETNVLDTTINYDELKRILALNYLTNEDTINYSLYIASIKDKYSLAASLNDVASNWAKVKPMRSAAERISLLSVSINDSLLTHPLTSKPITIKLNEWNEKLKRQKINCTTTYSYILYLSGKTESAINYMKPLYKDIKDTDYLFLEYYSLMLGESGNVSLSNQIILDLLLKGHQSPALNKQLKKNYITINGNDTDFEKYQNDINAKVKKSLIDRISKQINTKKSPDFIITNSENQKVSLKDLNDKVIILDFWATWCVPCLDSFPAMQMAVNKYKDNDSVKFIFIDTWENDKNYKELVKNYISKSGYKFNIAFDDMDKYGKQQKLSTLFKVKSLPTKIIIDKNGFIKFQEEGFSGSTNDLFNELSTKIDYLLNEKKKK